METATWTDLLSLAAVLLGAGALGGFIAGLLGVGGGIVIVPALFHLFLWLGVDPNVAMHVSVGTSLSTILATSLSSIRAHHSRGSVDWPLFRRWIPGIGAGVAIGTAIAGFAKGEVLTGVFAVVALLVAIYMGALPQGFRLARDLPKGFGFHVLGAFIGGISAMVGIGGGSLSVPAMVLCDQPMKRAVGTAAAIGFVIAIVGTIGFVIAGWGDEALPPWSLGYVSGLGFAIIVPTTVVLAPIGARVAHSVDVLLLKRIFALFLLATSIKMGWPLIFG